jgi:NAD-dependent dihydropyrimidine dehydrogenase PreA subunit
MPNKTSIILASNEPSSEAIRPLINELTQRLDAAPHIDLTVIPSFYDLSENSEEVVRIRSLQGTVLVLTTLFPRSAFWTLQGLGTEGARDDESAPTNWRFVDLKECDSTDAVLKIVEQASEAVIPECDPAEQTLVAESNPSKQETRWYPVIDFERCVQCLECLNFCLFGVYGVTEEGGILIEQPDACRDGCPACSRICPSGAIMFPKHDDPAIAGDERIEPDALKLDLSQIFGGADPEEMARRERDRAMDERTKNEATAGKGLDQLVDELDEFDL